MNVQQWLIILAISSKDFLILRTEAQLEEDASEMPSEINTTDFNSQTSTNVHAKTTTSAEDYIYLQENRTYNLIVETTSHIPLVRADHTTIKPTDSASSTASSHQSASVSENILAVTTQVQTELASTTHNSSELGSPTMTMDSSTKEDSTAPVGHWNPAMNLTSANIDIKETDNSTDLPTTLPSRTNDLGNFTTNSVTTFSHNDNETDSVQTSRESRSGSITEMLHHNTSTEATVSDNSTESSEITAKSGTTKLGEERNTSTESHFPRVNNITESYFQNIVNVTDEITDYLMRFEGACSEPQGPSTCQLLPFFTQKELLDKNLNCVKVVQLKFSYTVGSDLADSQSTLDTFKELVGKLEISYEGYKKLKLVEVIGLSLDYTGNGTLRPTSDEENLQMGRLSYGEFLSYVIIGSCFGCLILFAFCMLCVKCLKGKNSQRRFQDLPQLSLRLEDYRLTKIPRPNTIYNNEHFAEDAYGAVGHDTKTIDTDSIRLSSVYDTGVIPLDDFPSERDSTRYNTLNGREMQTFRSKGRRSVKEDPRTSKINNPNSEWTNHGRENPIYRP